MLQSAACRIGGEFDEGPGKDHARLDPGMTKGRRALIASASEKIYKKNLIYSRLMSGKKL